MAKTVLLLLCAALLPACAPSVPEPGPTPGPTPDPAVDGPLGLVFETTPDRGEPVRRVLPGLFEGSDVLAGPQLEVVTCAGEDCFYDHEAPAIADASGDFLYDPVLPPDPGSDDPAAEVNAWFHLQNFLARYGALGFSGFDEPALAVVGVDYDGWGILAGATGIDGRPTILFSRLEAPTCAGASPWSGPRRARRWRWWMTPRSRHRSPSSSRVTRRSEGGSTCRSAAGPAKGASSTCLWSSPDVLQRGRVSAHRRARGHHAWSPQAAHRGQQADLGARAHSPPLVARLRL